MLVDEALSKILRTCVMLVASFLILASLGSAQQSLSGLGGVSPRSVPFSDPLQYAKLTASIDDEGTPPATPPNLIGGGSTVRVSQGKNRQSERPDFNRDIYFRNKVEFSQDVGWLPINIPFPFDFMLSDQYQLYPLKYTLVPVIDSLRWQLGDIKGPLILRGYWEVEASLGVVAIPRGPETHYFTYFMGMRRNFVPRNWMVTPYFDWRAGLGYIDAKGPLGVPYAQGQDFTFTLNMGSGLRYNFGPRYAVTAGVNWMHISNGNLSEHKFDPNQHDPYGVENFGINVVGPMFGVDIQLRKHPRHSE
jgi:hypothetical protein